MRPFMTAAALASLLFVTGCGAGATDASTSAVASTSSSASASGSTPAPSRSPDPATFCQAAASLYAVMRTAKNSEEAARYLTTLAAGLRASAPEQMVSPASGFAMALDSIANGISSGTLDGTTATRKLDTLVEGADAGAIAKYCAALADSASPSASSSPSTS